jgi:hypothetical protein
MASRWRQGRLIKPGEEIHGSGDQRLRVLDVVPFDEEDESPFVGLLQVEAAYPALPLTAEQPVPKGTAPLALPLGREDVGTVPTRVTPITFPGSRWA